MVNKISVGEICGEILETVNLPGDFKQVGGHRVKRAWTIAKRGNLQSGES